MSEKEKIYKKYNQSMNPQNLDHTYADTLSNSKHISNVGSLTLDAIMGMDNDGYLPFKCADAFDTLYYYLLDSKSVREKMHYDWALDKEEEIK